MNNNNKELRLTIITVVLNAEKNIIRTIESINNNSEFIYEYIVIDGGSTDRTVDIIKYYYEKNIVTNYISEKDNGIFDAMNKGIAISKGNLIGILNAGDYYDDKGLSIVHNVFLMNNACMVFSGGIRRVMMNGRIISKVNTRGHALDNYLKVMPLFHPAMFVKKEIYDTSFTYNSYYKIAADYDFCIKLIRNKINIYIDNDFYTNMLIGGASEKKPFLLILELYKIRRQYSMFLNCIYSILLNIPSIMRQYVVSLFRA